MALNTFKTHPSVRIKGTESSFTPLQCDDPGCDNKTPHMHCPFCTKTESFHDPLILKAHYRVKHVDKGIEFAGLKILRCCEQCDMVGAIKGEKKFKGAHWHCYRCRNGFNRRDEAIKHYKTHFRNPQTTFQIQISQEVNRAFSSHDGHCLDEYSNVPTHILTEHIIESAESYTNDGTDECYHNGSKKDFSDVAANETIGAQTIMIIEEHDGGTHQHDSAHTIEFATPATESLQLAAFLEERSKFEKQIEDLTKQNDILDIEKCQLREGLMNEIENLKLQLAVQANEITNYQKREQQLISQLTVPVDDKTNELINQLQQSHNELIQNHLMQVRRSYLQQVNINGLQNNSTNNESSTIKLQYTMCIPENAETNDPVIIASDINDDAHTETWKFSTSLDSSTSNLHHHQNDIPESQMCSIHEEVTSINDNAHSHHKNGPKIVRTYVLDDKEPVSKKIKLEDTVDSNNDGNS